MAVSSSEQSLNEITVSEFADRVATQNDDQVLQLIDVREPSELAIAKLPGFIPLPLSGFAEWSSTVLQQLDPRAETIVMCHHGMRSAQMCYWLMSQGFTNVKNLVGGIDAYAVVVDPAVPRY